jgi:hypothetical protein
MSKSLSPLRNRSPSSIEGMAGRSDVLSLLSSPSTLAPASGGDDVASKQASKQLMHERRHALRTSLGWPGRDDVFPYFRAGGSACCTGSISMELGSRVGPEVSAKPLQLCEAQFADNFFALVDPIH